MNSVAVLTSEQVSSLIAETVKEAVIVLAKELRSIAGFSQQPEAHEEFMDRKQLMKYLNINSANYFCNLLKFNPGIKYTKIGKSYRFKRSQIDEYIANNNIRLKDVK